MQQVATDKNDGLVGHKKKTQEAQKRGTAQHPQSPSLWFLCFSVTARLHRTAV
jgi:hypothetical protein